jgi:hypothetical protein
MAPSQVVGAVTQTGSGAWILIGWVALAIAFASAAVILWDIAMRGYRQHMAVMNWVWPITALYWGPVAVWFYVRRGKHMTRKWAREHGTDLDEMMSGGDDEDGSGRGFVRRNWWPISKGVSDCGAGCTLGDIAGEWIVYLTAWSIPLFAAEAANSLMAMFVADFVLAWSLGILFQYFSIVPMREDVGRLEQAFFELVLDADQACDAPAQATA